MKPSDFSNGDGTSCHSPFYVKDSAKWMTEDVDKLGDFTIISNEPDDSVNISTASLYIVQVPSPGLNGHEFLLIHDSVAFVTSDRCMDEEARDVSTKKRPKPRCKSKKGVLSVKLKCSGINQEAETVRSLIDIELQPILNKQYEARQLRKIAEEMLQQAEIQEKKAEELANQILLSRKRKDEEHNAEQVKEAKKKHCANRVTHFQDLLKRM